MMEESSIEQRKEFAAPWGRLLKGMSSGVVVLMVGIAAMAVIDGSGLLILLLPLSLILALPFIIRGYAISKNMLVIKRLRWETKFSLEDLQSLEVDPKAMKGSIRLCGNGGLFSFTGLYRNKALGNYRAFINDWKNTVVLRFPKRTIVVSPDDPTGFVKAINGSTRKEDVT